MYEYPEISMCFTSWILDLGPFSGHLFAFCNRNNDAIKRGEIA